jgi:hypothetical protein
MTIAVRLAFVLLILLGAALQVHAVRLTDPGVNEATSLTAPLSALGLRGVGPDADGLITATAPGCAVPFRIGMFFMTGGEDTAAAALLGPSVRPRYVYLGLVSERDHRWPLYAWRVLGSAAATLGLRSKPAPKRLVLVALPEACPQLANLDWATLSPWN